jgi:hypothetical protein
MPKLIVRSETGEAVSHDLAEETEARPPESGARPADFANPSPFQSRKVKKDPARTAVLAVAALAFFTFLVSLVALVLMKPTSF